ncbi:hypothetical protein D9M68_568930 [compost metagenome]
MAMRSRSMGTPRGKSQRYWPSFALIGASGADQAMAAGRLSRLALTTFTADSSGACSGLFQSRRK